MARAFGINTEWYSLYGGMVPPMPRRLLHSFRPDAFYLRTASEMVNAFPLEPSNGRPFQRAARQSSSGISATRAICSRSSLELPSRACTDIPWIVAA